jgi:hypothetical protein
MLPTAIRLDETDEQILERLARRLGYSRSDTIRYALRTATVALSLPLPRPINDRLGTRAPHTDRLPTDYRPESTR